MAKCVNCGKFTGFKFYICIHCEKKLKVRERDIIKILKESGYIE